LGSFKPQTVQTVPPLPYRSAARDAGQSGFIRVRDKKPSSDGVLDESGHFGQQRTFARRDMKEIERQPMVHRREQVGLAQIDLLMPESAANRGGQTTVVPRGDAQ